MSALAAPLSAGARILITGGAGFIGSHLAERLLERGCHVSVLDNLSSGRLENIQTLIEHPRFHLTVGEIGDAAVLDGLVQACDMIFHLAAVVGVGLVIKDPLQVMEYNIFGTRCVLKAADCCRKPIYFASSSEVYGKREQLPFAEDDDLHLGASNRIRWSYAVSKAAAEHLCLAHYWQTKLPVVIFRLFNTVGPRQRGHYGMVVPRFVGQALNGEPLTVYGDGTQRRSFCDIEDVVSAMIALAQLPTAVGEIFNIGSMQDISILELAHTVATLVNGSTRHIAKVPYAEVYGPGFEDMQQRLPDLSKIQQVTNWSPQIPLQATLERIIACYR